MTSIRAAQEWLPLHQRLRAMMTKEEVAQVIAYCDENKISYKQRLAELGVNPWLLRRQTQICTERGRRECRRVPSVGTGRVIPSQPNQAFTVPQRQAERLSTGCSCYEHRAQNAHRNDV